MAMANHLAGSLSPYLRQHAQNPVDWWPWCDEAFAEARRRDVPILLSVGYPPATGAMSWPTSPSRTLLPRH